MCFSTTLPHISKRIFSHAHFAFFCHHGDIDTTLIDFAFFCHHGDIDTTLILKQTWVKNSSFFLIMQQNYDVSHFHEPVTVHLRLRLNKHSLENFDKSRHFRQKWHDLHGFIENILGFTF